MSKGRLLAFSDGVLAILITIMVLELHTPDGTVLLACGFAYLILQTTLERAGGEQSLVAHAIGNDRKAGRRMTAGRTGA